MHIQEEADLLRFFFDSKGCGGDNVLEGLTNNSHVVGAKQVRRAILNGKVQAVFCACDADPALTDPILELCEEHKLTASTQHDMRSIGRACGIKVGSAVAAIVV